MSKVVLVLGTKKGLFTLESDASRLESDPGSVRARKERAPGRVSRLKRGDARVAKGSRL